MSGFEIDKRALRRAFGRAAPGYDESAVLQHEVCVRMLERLDTVRIQPARVLDAGCGTGWGARQLAQRYPGAGVVALDIAQGMLQQARRQSGGWRVLFGRNRPHCLCADVEALPIQPGSMDLVWSNLTLQWCNDLPAAIAGLHALLKADGLLMFSTFGPDTLKEVRAAFRDVDGYNHTNRFADMHDIGDMLMAAGFSGPVTEMETLTLTYNDVKGMMQDLRAIGAHNVTEGRPRGLMGKTAWSKVVLNYEKLRRDGKLPATFEVIYAHAWKPQPKKMADGRAIVKTSFKL